MPALYSSHEKEMVGELWEKLWEAWQEHLQYLLKLETPLKALGMLVKIGEPLESIGYDVLIHV